MNVILNFCKSTIMATLVFWMIISTELFVADMFPIIIISIIPVFICCVIAITFTVYPFFRWFEKKAFDNKAVFNTFFPFYSMVHFGLCMYVILVSNFEIHVVAFFMASFITTSYSWVWFSKAPVS